MSELRLGTVDIPERVERDRYFDELTYLELSALYAGPQKPSVLAKFKDIAPENAIGLVAPWVLTHRQGPPSEKGWHHDNTVGDYRDSAHGRSALAMLKAAVEQLSAACVVFRSPPLFAPSAANRDRLREFFTNVATREAVGNVRRVWIPDGLWEPRTAVSFANELGVIASIDPLVVDPTEPFAFDDLDTTSVYFRVEGLGRPGALRTEDLEELAELVDAYEDVTIAFASPARWHDARNLMKLLGEDADA
jgi:uncharacterized protein YecE (DUF72 family)